MKATALMLAALCMAAGCQGFEDVPHCEPLPQGACPSSRGGSCQDKECAAIYTCTQDGWVLDARCDRDGGLADAEAERDAQWTCEASAQIEGAATGCDSSELLAPDCPVEAALGCAQTACLSGCADFFMCKTAGWVAVAYCDEDTGALIWLDGI